MVKPSEVPGRLGGTLCGGNAAVSLGVRHAWNFAPGHGVQGDGQQKDDNQNEEQSHIGTRGRARGVRCRVLRRRRSASGLVEGRAAAEEFVFGGMIRHNPYHTVGGQKSAQNLETFAHPLCRIE